LIAATQIGELNALAVADGTLKSHATLPGAPAAPDEQNVSQPLTGLAAAENQIFVPCGTQLIAF